MNANANADTNETNADTDADSLKKRSPYRVIYGFLIAFAVLLSIFLIYRTVIFIVKKNQLKKLYKGQIQCQPGMSDLERISNWHLWLGLDTVDPRKPHTWKAPPKGRQNYMCRDPV